MMKAAVVAQDADFGTPDKAISIVEREIPKARPGNVVVKLAYTSTNPIDAILSLGILNDLWGVKAPFYPGFDFSGTVHETGEEVEELKEGDAVWGVNWGRDVGQVQGFYKETEDESATVASTFSEYVEIAANKVSRKPEGLGHDQAAALALVGNTALQSINNILTEKSPENSRILILGGSTAVGQLGIQLAKLRGISFVATTCSPRTREYVDTLGADLVIDYTTDKWDDLEKFPQLKSLTGVFDCVGKPEFSTWNLANESGVLAEDGNYVAISFDQTVGRDYKGHPPKPWASMYVLKNNTKHQDELAKLVVEGKLKLKIDEEFAFSKEGVVGCLAKQMSGKSLGKNVIKF